MLSNILLIPYNDNFLCYQMVTIGTISQLLRYSQDVSIHISFSAFPLHISLEFTKSHFSNVIEPKVIRKSNFSRLYFNLSSIRNHPAEYCPSIKWEGVFHRSENIVAIAYSLTAKIDKCQVAKSHKYPFKSMSLRVGKKYP